MTNSQLHEKYEELREKRINNKLMNYKVRTEPGDIQIYEFDITHGSHIRIMRYWGKDPATNKSVASVFIEVTNFCNEPELVRLAQKFGGFNFRLTFESLYKRDAWVSKFMKRCKKIPTPYQRRRLRSDAAKGGK